MADYVHATITIGGKLQRAQIWELELAITEDTGFTRLLEDRMEDDRIVILKEQVHNGEFDSIEPVCRHLGLTYTRVSGGCAGFAPEEVWWDPECDSDTHRAHILDHDGDTVVAADEVGKLVASYWAEADKHSGVPDECAGRVLAEKLAELVDEWGEVPPFEIIE